MSHEEYRKIVEEIKRYQFSADVPELTDSEPGIEQMEVISINDMFNILNRKPIKGCTHETKGFRKNGRTKGD